MPLTRKLYGWRSAINRWVLALVTLFENTETLREVIGEKEEIEKIYLCVIEKR